MNRNHKGQFAKNHSLSRMGFVDHVHPFAMDAQFHYTGEEPVICTRFGCGKTLGPKERVYGDRCVSHQKPIPYTSLIDPYIYQ
jgi:hypothetical protein